MSLASLNSFGEIPPSLHLEIKSFRRGESSSSENFQTFLSNSPFLVSTKTSLGSRSKNHFNFQETEPEKGFEEATDIIHHKRTYSTIQGDRTNSLIKVPRRESEFMNSLRFESLESQTTLTFPAESRIFNNENEDTTTVNKRRNMSTISGLTNVTYNQGYESPKGAKMDEATKLMIRQLQSRVVGLEKELVKTRKENFELKKQNKVYQEKMASVIEVQEKAAKMKDYYEREAKKLRENANNNLEIVSSLKGILSMQDEEYYGRLMTTKENNPRSKVNLKKRLASPQGTPQVSTMMSIEAGIMKPAEGLRSPNKSRSVVKIMSTKGSRNSLAFEGTLTSVKSRKMSQIRTKTKED